MSNFELPKYRLMNAEERLNLCKVCKNRKFTLQKGIVCGLTGEKPTFEESCDAYIEDSVEKEKLKRLEEEQAQEGQILGDPISDGPEKLSYANWFTIIGYLSLFNIALNFVEIEFIFSLGTTQLAQVFMLDGVISPVLGLFTMLALPGLLLWTGYLAAKKGDRLAYMVGTLLFLFDTGLVIWLWSVVDYSPDLIVNVLFHVALSAIFLVCLILMATKKRVEEQQMTKSRVVYLVASVVVLLINIPLLLNRSGLVATSDQKIERICENTREVLPQDVAPGITWVDVCVEGNTVVFLYKRDFSNIELSHEFCNLMSIYGKEIFKHNDIPIDEDPLINEIVNNGEYDLRCEYYDYDMNYVYSVTLSADDIICSGASYSTSEDSWEELLDAYKCVLPFEIDENINLLSIDLSKNRKNVEYKIEFVDAPLYWLNSLSNSDFREFAESFEIDYAYSLAQINGKKLVFHFVSSESSTWYKRVEL